VTILAIVYPHFLLLLLSQNLCRLRSSSLLEARLYQLRRDSIKKGARDLKAILAFLKTQQEDVTTSPPPPAASPISSTSSVASASTFTPVANSLPASSAKPDEYPTKKVVDLLGDVDLLVGPLDHWNHSVELLGRNGTIPLPSSPPLFPWFSTLFVCNIL